MILNHWQVPDEVRAALPEETANQLERAAKYFRAEITVRSPHVWASRLLPGGGNQELAGHTVEWSNFRDPQFQGLEQPPLTPAFVEIRVALGHVEGGKMVMVLEFRGSEIGLRELDRPLIAVWTQGLRVSLDGLESTWARKDWVLD